MSLRATLGFLFLAPFLAINIVWVLLRIPRLPEPDGPRKGQAGEGRVLRLLIIGDSAAAGVGVDHQDQALSGQLVKQLSKTRCLGWRLIAKSGAATASTLSRLQCETAADFDVVLIVIGVNDVKNMVPMERWASDMAVLLNLVKVKFKPRLTLVSALPPIGQFPALPQPLRWVLGRRAIRFDKRLRYIVAAHRGAGMLDFDIDASTDLMARDGFHPSATVYAACANAAGVEINKLPI